ncbi:uncharacterized protein CcaverHIS019_0212030 [Cutaneotrichosporon cavernicola]|uniref:Zn(2)-C6 fungal-type domain-containing protein n=1 Tax=Cutaneotrichosporon cavernicola TaxID=279322 RepID=A0AA48L0G0_9TREE|nr:uncharacterized protein CcaverHIS019_0212030 [Cutaneotrichosporon cavernicola]BEI89841.1 hypothetical protein CcaverHIS019_0212030 [Cutaneotrichosporon cavernicola]BEI97611.1 hypothetical protein CcaverHIS631_0212000 [Cutaneotrichosporon cavernicola]BEJ05390.1 hypothetical protein CcaverHIS641_0212070 [Cutaneotrichosporon cavernicola]
MSIRRHSLSAARSLPRDPSRSPTQILLPASAKQACQACQQRKRKCDRKQPRCSMCEKRQIDCVFDLKGDPTLLADALAALEEREARVHALELRVAALEGIIRSVPELAHLANVSTEALSDRSPVSVEAEMAAVSLDDRRDRGSEPLPPELVDTVEEGLAALHHPQRLNITNTMHIHLGAAAARVEETSNRPPAEWPNRDRAELLVDTFISMNPLYPMYWKDDMRKDLAAVMDGTATALQEYTMTLVFAIACQYLAQRDGEQLDTAAFRQKAFSLIGVVLRTESAIRCAEALFLLTLYGVFDWANPAMAHASPLASHILRTLELYHDPPATLSPRERDRRRAFFWSQYGIDQGLASLLFNFPVGFEGVQITMAWPESLDDSILARHGIDPIETTKLNVEMRQIEWSFASYQRGTRLDVRPSELITRLEGWYERAQRITRKRPQGPTSTHLDMYYHLLRGQLHGPHLDPHGGDARIMRESARSTLEYMVALNQQSLMGDSYFHFNYMIIMGMVLLYAVLRLDGDPSKCDAAWCSAAIDDVEKCQAYLRSFCKGWPQTRVLSHTFDCFAARAIAQLQIHFASPASMSLIGVPTPDVGAKGGILTAVNPVSAPFEDQQNMALVDETEGDVDALLSMLGWNAEWLPELLPNFQ